MRVLFMGTSEFAVPVLQSLIDSFADVVGVMSAPDKVRGRGNKLVASPVAQVSEAKGIPTYKPTTLRDPQIMELIRELNPEVICVAAYGKIIPPEVIEYPVKGCLNVHGSLLPRWRGAAPIERAILAGDKELGVCIMRVEEGLDTGSYCSYYATDLGDRSFTEMSELLASQGAALLCDTLRQLDALDSFEALPWVCQDEGCVCYAEKIEAHELNLSPDMSAEDIVVRVRASHAAHPSKCVLAGKPLTVLAVGALVDEELPEVRAGNALLWRKRLIISATDGWVELVRVKPDGKKEMNGAAFAAGIQGIKKTPVKWGSVE